MSDERRRPPRDRFDDLKSAYALGALTEDERREFEGYLATYPELQAEVEQLVSAADLLALAPQEHEPPPELRRNLLNRIGGDADATLVEAPQRRAGLRRLFGPGGLAAVPVAVLAVVGLFAWNASLRGENEDLQGELESRQTYELQGSGAAQDARGEVVEVGDGRAILVAENLPPVSEDEVYETWLMRDGIPEPAGLFEPSAGGIAATPVEASLEGADAVAVTVEPSGGSPTPTSDILLTATL